MDNKKVLTYYQILLENRFIISILVILAILIIMAVWFYSQFKFFQRFDRKNPCSVGEIKLQSEASLTFFLTYLLPCVASQTVDKHKIIALL